MRLHEGLRSESPLKPILFVFGSETSYRLQRLVAAFCAAQGRPIAYAYDRPPDAFFERALADAASLGAAAVSLDAQVVAGERPQSAYGAGVRAAALRAILAARRREQLLAAAGPREQMLARALLRGPLSQPGQRAAREFTALVESRLAAAEKLLARIDPAVVVVSEDGVSGPLALIAAAHRAGIRVVDVPFGYGTADDFDVDLAHKEKDGNLVRPAQWDRAVLRALAPQWIKRGRFAGATLFPAEMVMAYEGHGLRVRDAWIVHGGYADRLLAESRQMLGLYRREGIPASKLALTGSPYCDVLAEGARAEPAAQAALRQPRRIDPARTRILVSWPPSYHASRRQFAEFPTYREMTLAVLGWLARLPDCSVTLSMHPAAPEADRAAVRETGLAFADEYVIRLIPRHDIYVSYFSSTIRWAIAAGKPVVGYDAYKLELPVYDAAPGFVNARDVATFKQKMLELVASADAFAAAAARQVSVAEDWGSLDGRCTERVAAEIDAQSR